MAMERIQLERSGRDPLIEVVVGQAQLGAFRISVKSPGHAGRDVVRYVPGPNTQPPGPTPIGPIGQLDDSILAWEVDVLPAGLAAGQRFSVQIRVTQATTGSVSERGRLFSYGGAINGLIQIGALVEIDVL